MKNSIFLKKNRKYCPNNAKLVDSRSCLELYCRTAVLFEAGGSVYSVCDSKVRPLRVVKIGGSSLTDAASFNMAIDKVLNDSIAQLIVVSACYGVTDELCHIAKDAMLLDRDQQLLYRFDLLEKKHRKLAEELKLANSFLNEIDHSLQQLLNCIESLALCYKETSHELLLSFGETLSSILFSGALSNKQPALLFDVRHVLRTDETYFAAQVDLDQLKLLAQNTLCPLLHKERPIVTQGFIGASPTGQTTTLGRGGSDYSAALLAEALQADEVYIWKDVAGIYDCDPKLDPNAHRFAQLTYFEAATICQAGAQVVHPATFYPLMRGNIPLFVGSTFVRQAEGTWVLPHDKELKDLNMNMNMRDAS